MIEQTLNALFVLLWGGFLLLLARTLWRRLRRQGPRPALATLRAPAWLGSFAVLLLATLLRAAVVFVYPQYMGVVVSVVSPQGVRPAPLMPGLHLIVPLLEQVVLYPRYWQTYTMSDRIHEGQMPAADGILARTKDGQEIRLDVTLIFRLEPENVVEVHILWQDRYTDQWIRPATRAFARQAISAYTVDEVNSEQRVQVTESIQNQAIARAAENGLIVRNFLIRNITFTEEYSRSVEEKQVALQGEIRTQYEARQIENLAGGEANRITVIAEAEARAVRIRAEADAAARVVRARADAEALTLVGAALDQQGSLLTYRYIEKLSPNIRAMLLPANHPLILPTPEDIAGPLPPRQPPSGVDDRGDSPPPGN